MAEEQVDMENISLHGYIRNTPSDTEMHVEHQLRANRSTQPEEKNMQNHKNSVGQRNQGEKQECQQDWTCPQQVGELKQGSDPHSGAIVWVRGETFKAERETADLWQPKWNENQTVLATAIHMPGRNTGLLEGAVAGSWNLGIMEQSQGEGCC